MGLNLACRTRRTRDLATLDTTIEPEDRPPHGAGRFFLNCALIYLTVFGAASLIAWYEFPAPADAHAVRAAEFASSSATTPAGVPAGAWQTLPALPDDWRHREQSGRDGWYRLQLELPEPVADLWAVVLPTVRLNAGVYINGHLVGNGGRFEDPVARNLRRPFIFNVPGDTLRQGTNEILIHVRAGPDGIGFLSEAYFGPEKSLRAAYRIHFFARITSVQLITVLLGLIGGAIGVLALLRPANAEYRYFSIGVLVWVVHSLTFFVVRIPVSDRLWDWMTFATVGYFAVMGGMAYVHRYLGLRMPRVEAATVAFVVAFTLLLAVLPERIFYQVGYYVWYPFCQCFGFYGLLRMLQVGWRRRSYELHVVAASGVVLSAYAFHDLLLVFARGDWQDGYYIHFAMLLIVGIFCAVLLQRFVRSANEAESLNRDLERRVAANAAELDRRYSQLQTLENQRVLADERERLMRDMHDGIGGQLVSTLALIDRDVSSPKIIENSLRGALQDLRLMIDSLDVAGDDISTMLGMFRSRVEPSLSAQQIRLFWEVGDVDDIPGFGASKALQVLRILQEAVTNVLRHSDATELRIGAHDLRETGAGTLSITLSDNGKGIGADTGNGRGLTNMRHRAEAIGAELRVDSSPAGTTVEFRYDRRSLPREAAN